MSQENVELVSEAVDAFNRRDFDAFIARVHPDVEWDDTEGFPGVRGVYRGRAGVREWWKAWLEARERIHFEVEEITEGSDGRVLVGGLVTGRGRGSGVETEARSWYVGWFQDGKLARWKLCWARDDAIEAAGLREPSRVYADVLAAG
jgi:ketosteroid isomerase-like protein